MAREPARVDGGMAALDKEWAENEKRQTQLLGHSGQVTPSQPVPPRNVLIVVRWP